MSTQLQEELRSLAEEHNVDSSGSTADVLERRDARLTLLTEKENLAAGVASNLEEAASTRNTNEVWELAS